MKAKREMAGCAVLTVTVLVAAHGASAQRSAWPEECRQRPALRDCVSAGGTVERCRREALQNLPDVCRKALSARAAANAGPLPNGWREISFGSDARQKIDVVVPKGSAKSPLLLFIHGGGWSIGDKRLGAEDKGVHFLSRGWAFASTNYRLVPQATVEQQAEDIVAAIAVLRRQPGIDPDRIVLMGHSAGAHLAALVASDDRYLRAAGVPMAAVRGVVLLDGAGYDVGRQMSDPRNAVATMYRQAFGADSKRHAALSPITHAGAPNAAEWLILPVATRQDSTAQSEALAAALRKSGSRVMVEPQSGKTHRTLNKDIGQAGDPPTEVIDAFLQRLR